MSRPSAPDLAKCNCPDCVDAALKLPFERVYPTSAGGGHTIMSGRSPVNMSREETASWLLFCAGFALGCVATVVMVIAQ